MAVRNWFGHGRATNWLRRWWRRAGRSQREILLWTGLWWRWSRLVKMVRQRWRLGWAEVNIRNHAALPQVVDCITQLYVAHSQLFSQCNQATPVRSIQHRTFQHDRRSTFEKDLNGSFVVRLKCLRRWLWLTQRKRPRIDGYGIPNCARQNCREQWISIHQV